MNRKYIVELSAEEKCELVNYCKKGMVNVRKYKRAAILLKADRCRYTTDQICEAVQVSSSTVFRVKRQFVEDSLEAALNEGARSGAMRKTSAKDEVTLIATACSEPPTGHCRWTLA
ncbi:helix-turn-helix domain-containing protein [Pseudoalteromonas sp. SG41-5]|nr:helix-turn-helix domain-containing protein [Pseudoalteromonas sp. SG41-5]MBB1470227.1 helix-turn-helix domain-containing protein [Pseudoalteromonas sp. SG41-5]